MSQLVTFYASRLQYANHLWAVAEKFHKVDVGYAQVLGVAREKEIAPGLVVVASRKDARSLKDRPVALLEHGAGQTYGAAERGRDWAVPNDNVLLFLAPSERVVDRNRDIYPNARCVVVSSPWVEKLAEIRNGFPWNEDVTPDTLVFTFHYEGSIVPEAGSAFSHFRDVLTEAKRVWDGPIVGTAHPRMMRRIKGWYEDNGIEIEPNFAKLVRRMKVLVADNTSAIWEACALDVPVVLMNSPNYRTDVEMWPRFWDWSVVGPNIWNVTDLEWALEHIDGVHGYRAWARGEATSDIYGGWRGAGFRAAEEINRTRLELFANQTH